MNKREISLSELLAGAAQNEMSPTTYQYYKGLLQNRVVINDSITADIIDSAVIPLIDMDADPDVKHIEIILNSEGGEIYSGMALCRTIENLKTETSIFIPAVCASMGALIAMAGRNNPQVTTICTPYSIFLLHGGSFFFEGSANQVRDTFAFQEEYEKILTEYILSHTSIPEELYEKKTRYEWWLTANEGLEYGIVDKIV